MLTPTAPPLEQAFIKLYSEISMLIKGCFLIQDLARHITSGVKGFVIVFV